MAIYVASHIVNNCRAGITDFDLASLTLTKIMRSVRDWLPVVRDVATERLGNNDFNIQALLMSVRKAEDARELFESGTIDELAFVHSHDPWVLWENSWIRKVDTGRIEKHHVIGDVDNDLAEKMRETSRKRYQLIREALESTGVPINVYQMNATGARDRITGKSGSVDPDVVLREMERVAPINGGRQIICDTEAIADPEDLRPLENLMTAVSQNVRDAVGIHLHILNSRSREEVREIVRQALQPICLNGVGECFIETGVAGLGGCTAFVEGNQNAPAVETVRAADQLVEAGLAEWPTGRPNTDIIQDQITPHVKAWDEALKRLVA